MLLVSVDEQGAAYLSAINILQYVIMPSHWHAHLQFLVGPAANASSNDLRFWIQTLKTVFSEVQMRLQVARTAQARKRKPEVSCRLSNPLSYYVLSLSHPSESERGNHPLSTH